MDQPMDSMFCTSLGDSFCSLDVDELEILQFFDFVSGAQQIDHNIGVLHHSLDLLLVLEVHGVVHPGPV